MNDRTRKTIALTAQLVTAVTAYTEARFETQTMNPDSAEREMKAALAKLNCATLLYAKHLGAGESTATAQVVEQIEDAVWGETEATLWRGNA